MNAAKMKKLWEWLMRCVGMVMLAVMAMVAEGMMMMVMDMYIIRVTLLD